ncbi:hypothetical protein BP5796_06670 [Coleophoma crateriformis]|uniref:Carboxylic ester hydrolase n=1 Tax=Coleophoma crateriformis TaxID=565419 RepID=A0A3D8RP71_9HELO|nr:hypothetical protein BP5796_06670 [Coleophoma crateriformis]
MFCAALVMLSFLAFLTNGHPRRQVNLQVDLGYSTYVGASVAKGVNQWLGIRYATPPLGHLRFRKPQPPAYQEGVQKADTRGAVCMPTPSTGLRDGFSEDCLFVDIYAPSRSNRHGHPVFVNFQGGGFNTLAAPTANGTSLVVASNYDIVVVTFNYRVGLWGFLASKEVSDDGDLNVGLLDQRLLLEWVQEHIHLFGGNPNHVTIAGASAGGASVDLHLSAYGGRDDGLFHAAAAESQSFGAQLTVAQSQYQYDHLVNRVGCNNSTNTLACLRCVDVELLATNNLMDLPTPGGAGGPPVYMFSNVIDGNFTPDYTYNLYAEGKFVKVPVIFGDDTNEGTIFTPTNINNVTAMNNFLKNNWVGLTSDQLAQIDIYWPKAEQFPNSGEYWRAAANAYGEMRYNCPGIYLSGQFPKYGVNSSWNYHWDVLDPDNAISGFGVTHTSEFASIWGSSSAPDSSLIPTIQGYWTSFIRSKDPNKYRLAGSPVWETFSAQSQRRIHFPNNVSAVGMENVPVDQARRCAYASSIGVSLSQ